MASTLISLLDSPEQAARIAATAAAQAVERYGVDRHVTEISAIYRSLLADERQGKHKPW
jgi:glycosyltransferase involved in cell wall biosynthesis